VSKVENACIYAFKYDFKWIWIDSCCINKENSAELSEAINSIDFFLMECGNETNLCPELVNHPKIFVYTPTCYRKRQTGITIHVALGIRGSTAWTDILSIENHCLNQETPRMIWRSYVLNSGLRAHHRHRRSVSLRVLDCAVEFQHYCL